MSTTAVSSQPNRIRSSGSVVVPGSLSTAEVMATEPVSLAPVPSRVAAGPSTVAGSRATALNNPLAASLQARLASRVALADPRMGAAGAGGLAVTAPPAGLKRGMQGANVKRLQQCLVQLGYLTQKQVSTGPGAFGPRTQAAVAHFQRDHHLRPATGNYGPRTALALERALNGTSSNPQPQPTPGPVTGPGVPTSNSHHGNVPHISQVHPNGEDSHYQNGRANCGPTSMAQVARAYGYGHGLTDAQLIMKFARAGGTLQMHGTSINGLHKMAAVMGKPAHSYRGPNAGAAVDWIENQLKKGKLVVANGDFWALPGGGRHDQPGTAGHYVTVSGMDSQGRFIVDDPGIRGGSNLHVTRAQLENFIRQNRGVNGFQTAIG
jgi:hypothetical protein